MTDVYDRMNKLEKKMKKLLKDISIMKQKMKPKPSNTVLNAND